MNSHKACKCKCGTYIRVKATKNLPVEGIRHPIGAFVDETHVMVYIENNRRSKAVKLAKQVKKKNAQHKKEYYAKDIKVRKAAAKRACHKYIRMRDKDKGCICCGEALVGKYDAGHFLESGNNPKIRYHEDNIHGQRVYCNQYKGGNSAEYERQLRIRIGDKRVDFLLSMKGAMTKGGKPYKYTVEDYVEIEKKYKDKSKKQVL